VDGVETMSATTFLETEALLAVMNNDLDELLKVLRAMTPGEQEALRAAAARLASLIRDLDHPVWDWKDRPRKR
jgi:hypothetical protein